MYNFYSGQRVVCIMDAWERWVYELGIVVPVKGTVYTVKHVVRRPNGLGLRLFEVQNPVIIFCDAIAQPLWVAYAFRPLVEVRTDISVFTRILDDVSRRYHAPEGV